MPWQGDILYVPERWWHEIRNLRGRNLAAQLVVQFPELPRFGERLRARGVNLDSYAAHDLVNAAIHLRTSGLTKRLEEERHLSPILRTCLERSNGDDEGEAHGEAPTIAPTQWDERVWHAALNRTDPLQPGPMPACVAF